MHGSPPPPPRLLQAGVELPELAFEVGTEPAACRLSDDYWLAHWMATVGVRFELLPGCVYDYGRGRWPSGCGTPFRPVPHVESIDALSQTLVNRHGHETARAGGDWRDQLGRYAQCQALLLAAGRRDEF